MEERGRAAEQRSGDCEVEVDDRTVEMIGVRDGDELSRREGPAPHEPLKVVVEKIGGHNRAIHEHRGGHHAQRADEASPAAHDRLRQPFGG